MLPRKGTTNRPQRGPTEYRATPPVGSSPCSWRARLRRAALASRWSLCPGLPTRAKPPGVDDVYRRWTVLRFGHAGFSVNVLLPDLSRQTAEHSTVKELRTVPVCARTPIFASPKRIVKLLVRSQNDGHRKRVAPSAYPPSREGLHGPEICSCHTHSNTNRVLSWGLRRSLCHRNQHDGHHPKP